MNGGRGTFQGPRTCFGAFLIPALRLFHPAERSSWTASAKAFRKHDPARDNWHLRSPAGVLPRAPAWGGLVITSAFMLALMVLTSPVQRGGARASIVTAIGRCCPPGVTLIAVLLSISTRSAENVSTSAASSRPKATTKGRFGRFGRHIPRARTWRLAICRSASARCSFHHYFPGRYPQLLSECLHVGRLDLRRLLSRRWWFLTVIIGFPPPRLSSRVPPWQPVPISLSFFGLPWVWSAKTS